MTPHHPILYNTSAPNRPNSFNYPTTHDNNNSHKSPPLIPLQQYTCTSGPISQLIPTIHPSVAQTKEPNVYTHDIRSHTHIQLCSSSSSSTLDNSYEFQTPRVPLHTRTLETSLQVSQSHTSLILDLESENSLDLSASLKHIPYPRRNFQNLNKISSEPSLLSIGSPVAISDLDRGKLLTFRDLLFFS